MDNDRGRTLALSPARRLLLDLLRASRDVPLVPIQRGMRLAPLIEARQRMTIRPSWVAMVGKAFAIVAARRPELRRSFLSWPRPRLYEHPHSVMAVIVERECDGEMSLLPALYPQPESTSIAELSNWLQECKQRPISEIRAFRRALRVARWPAPVRRLAWWGAMEWNGRCRARQFGTFGVSVTASFGADTLAVRSPLTTTLHYGTLEADGSLPMRLTFDHRVLDGANVARALVEMEAVLLGAVLDELRASNRVAAA